MEKQVSANRDTGNTINFNFLDIPSHTGGRAMSEHDCGYGEILKEIKSEIAEMRVDIRSLMRFKWQAMGVIATLCFAITVGISLVNKG